MDASADDSALKAAIARTFSTTSPYHDSVGPPLFAHFGRSLVARLELRGDERILDVAAGTGATLFPAAERLGDDGRVIGVDLAPGMVDRLKAEIVRRHTVTAEARVADAEALPFDDGAFDALVCGFGLFFFPDVDGALAEFRRVLRPGGAIAASTFTERGSASFDRIWQLISAYAEIPGPAAGLRSLDRADELRDALGAAGFERIDVDVAPFELTFAGVDEWWAWLWTMEFRDSLAPLSPPTLGGLRRYAAEQLADGDERKPIRFQMDALLTLAHAPARARSS
jgi:O-methyltransferase/aklanonic acid methyltransferase